MVRFVSAPFAKTPPLLVRKSRSHEKCFGDHVPAGIGFGHDVGFAGPCPIISVVELSGCRQSRFQACQLLRVP